MTWADLEWPDLSPEFPEPVVSRPAPPRPDVPADIAELVRNAERRRAAGVWLCILTGAALVAAACALYVVTLRASAPEGGAASAALARATWPSLALLVTGLVAAFPVAALAALRLGPTWEQRSQQWRAARWQSDYAHWLGIQRLAYIHALPLERRAALSRCLGERAERLAR